MAHAGCGDGSGALKFARWLRRAPAGTAQPPWLRPYPPAATEADILACFRLILGRNPHEEEWVGHAAQAGQPLPGVVAGYVNSLEFARRGLAEAKGGEVELVTLPRFRIHLRPDDAAVGQHVKAQEYELDVSEVFRRLLQPGMGVIDIGANIGYFSMLSAALVGPSGWVLAVEPNPDNARLLEASRRVNGFAQLHLAQLAAGPEIGLLVLHTSHSNGTTSAPADDPAQLLTATTVPCVRVDALVPPEQRIDLIKIDVEGSEPKALAGCEAIIRSQHPTIISEFSPDMMAGLGGMDGPGYLQRLIALNYDLSVIRTDSSLDAKGQDWPAIMAAYAACGIDHIDIVATPKG